MDLLSEIIDRLTRDRFRLARVAGDAGVMTQILSRALAGTRKLSLDTASRLLTYYRVELVDAKDLARYRQQATKDNPTNVPEKQAQPAESGSDAERAQTVADGLVVRSRRAGRKAAAAERAARGTAGRNSGKKKGGGK